MRVFGWSKPKEPPDELRDVMTEAKELKAELAQSVVTFERRHSRIAKMANDAMAFMNDGEPR